MTKDPRNKYQAEYAKNPAIKFFREGRKGQWEAYFTEHHLRVIEEAFERAYREVYLEAVMTG